MKLKFILICLLIATQFIAYGQQSSEIIFHVTETKAVKIGHTKPVKELVKIPLTSAEKKTLWKEINRPPKDFKSRNGRYLENPEKEHLGEDKVRQKTNGPESNPPIIPLVNIEGQDFGKPNDPTGDIGLDYYMQAVNSTHLAIYNKTGTKIDEFSANTLWASIGFSSAGDPIVLYDQEENRWIITEFPNGNQLLVAISENGDPLGSYDVYNFNTPDFPDYPKYGLWNNALTVTTNEFSPSNLSTYVINRQQLLNAENEISIQRIEIEGNASIESGFFVATPVDWTGKTQPKQNSGPYFLSLNDSSWGQVDDDQVNFWEFDIDWENPENTQVFKDPILLSPFDTYPCASSGVGFSCIPQPESNNGLDGIPDVIMNQAHYRNFDSHESIVFSFITDATDGENISGIRWVELRKYQNGEWALYQEGTFAPDDELHRFMPGICMDRLGNIALAYNVSGENEYVGIRLTGRKSGDPLGLMTVDETLVVSGKETVQTFGRFGDYGQMVIDPVDDLTFWYTSEYANGNNNSTGTRIVAFEVGRDEFDLAAIKLLAPASSNLLTDQESIKIRIRNNGTAPVSSFQIGYQINDLDPVLAEVNQNLTTDQLFDFTFNEKVDLSQEGIYQIKYFVHFPDDKAIFNDTLLENIRHYYNLDAAITNVQLSNEANFLCDTFAEFECTILNEGADALVSGDIIVKEDGNDIAIYPWTGNILFGESQKITFPISGLTTGIHLYTMEFQNPNGSSDENFTNNTSEITINVFEDPVEINLHLSLDYYAEETTWEIVDPDGNVLYQGGPYLEPFEELDIPLCLSQDGCYTFHLLDSYGDGMEEDGNYEITNQDGTVLANLLNPMFAYEESNTFCSEFTCLLDFEIEFNAESSEDSKDGTILILPINGVGPFQYSINGGGDFTNENLFNGLSNGSYNIQVEGMSGCQFSTTLVLGPNATQETTLAYSIEIIPNPNLGYFNLKVVGNLEAGPILDYKIYDANGRFMHQNSIGKYNDTYIGKVNITSYPAGVYYIQILSKEVHQLVKIIKQ